MSSKKMTRAEHVEKLTREFEVFPHWSAYADQMANYAVDYAVQSMGAQVEPDRVRIKRGDVIETPEDEPKWIIPPSTAFRLSDCSVHSVPMFPQERSEVRLWPEGCFPLRCIDVPGDDGE